MNDTPGLQPGFNEAMRPAGLPVHGLLRLGSWRLDVAATHRRYTDALCTSFRQVLLPTTANLDAKWVLRGVRADDPLFGPEDVPGDGSTATWETTPEGLTSLYTGAFRVLWERASRPERLLLLVREPPYSERAFRDGLFKVVYKILNARRCFYLHAGAVDFHGKVSAFVGQGSFGKTTTVLRLAKAGATVLSEDHVLLHGSGDGVRVSGCQDTARVTPKTEAFIFDKPLDVVPVEQLGVSKKEFMLADYFPAAPYTEHSLHRLFFNERAASFGIHPLSEAEAVTRLMQMTQSFYRFEQPCDTLAYLDTFARMVDNVDCFALHVSDDPGELDQLVEFLAS